MIAAPLLTVGVPVDLPKTQANNVPGQDEPLVVSIDKSGTIYLQETEVALEQLAPRLQAVTGANPDARIFVRGDQSIQYGLIMRVMGALNTAGFTRVALIAELPKPGQGN
jgi:biopolymer transport protein TolR